MQSSGRNGRLGRWAALLSTWTLEINRCNNKEEEVLGILAAIITPREDVDDMLIAISPRKQPRQIISMPPPTASREESILVVSVDGAARIQNKGGSYSAITWKLPEWTIVSAASRIDTGLTVNRAEYHGSLLSCELLDTQTRERVFICGDSNLVIRQIWGEIDCKAPGLQLLRLKALDLLRS
uniref:RNase H type-1 domain-containing protein n=1 Tax=Peronospora matthiolae TaxID=2874970 RepID=A0AAV1TZE0_9STRA